MGDSTQVWVPTDPTQHLPPPREQREGSNVGIATATVSHAFTQRFGKRLLPKAPSSATFTPITDPTWLQP